MGGLPSPAAAKIVRDAVRRRRLAPSTALTAGVVGSVLENLRTHRFRGGRTFRFDDAAKARMTELCMAVAPEGVTQETAGRIIDILEREIAPFMVWVP